MNWLIFITKIRCLSALIVMIFIRKVFKTTTTTRQNKWNMLPPQETKCWFTRLKQLSLSRERGASLSLISWRRLNYSSLIRKRLTELNRCEREKKIMKTNHLIVHRRQCSIVEATSKQKVLTATAVKVFVSQKQMDHLKWHSRWMRRNIKGIFVSRAQVFIFLPFFALSLSNELDDEHWTLSSVDKLILTWMMKDETTLRVQFKSINLSR